MGDIIPFRKRKRQKSKAPDDFGIVLPTARWRGSLSRAPRSRRWLAALRPWVLLITLIGAWHLFDVSRIEPLPGFSSDPEKVTGSFTRCGMGRGTFCVVDGDTFKLGERTVRVLGIDAPEMFPAHCPAEAELGEQATANLQRLLNQGPFIMTGRVNDLQDRYGRDLRALSRLRSDGTSQSITEDLLASGTVRRYLGGLRGGWC